MKATIQHLHIAPRKVRRVADLIRNKSVNEAAALLRFTKEKPAKDLAKLLKSAVANAKNTIGKEADALIISKVTVDQGAVFKRFRTKWHGMASPIRKKTSHVRIELAERATKEKVSPSE
ncbi:MAG: 50S ribosomal protein L22 [Candidatus Niyogibacteria bacterium]|nr:50S ribosomal protein L22 [Candidatus Niyogibacteria bacterium]